MENQSNNKPQHELVTLEPIEMNGPVEVTVETYVMNPAINKVCRMSFCMNIGVIPTRSEIQDVVNACLDPENMLASGLPQGARLLTKPEFVAHVTTRETGRAIPLPGNQEFVPSTCEIPHDMLVHAIVGVGTGSYEMAQDFTQRGLARFSGNQHNEDWSWNTDKLAALPDAMLMAIYKELTNGH